jgi:hypothetical protein
MVMEAFIIAMIVLFIHATTWEGQIMSWVKKLVNEDSYISKPIYGCPICMTPWWGTATYLILFGWGGWRDWLGIIGCASGISVISVIGIYIKDYCANRTFDNKNKCC